MGVFHHLSRMLYLVSITLVKGKSSVGARSRRKWWKWWWWGYSVAISKILETWISNTSIRTKTSQKSEIIVTKYFALHAGHFPCVFLTPGSWGGGFLQFYFHLGFTQQNQSKSMEKMFNWSKIHLYRSNCVQNPYFRVFPWRKIHYVLTY